MAELMGRCTGICGGVGGSQHLHRGNFYSNGVQGGIVPVATGMAFAEKAKVSGAVVAVFMGDGTMGQGAVYESFNIAAKWRLPVLFVTEDNGYAQTTPSGLVHAGDLKDRARPFGIETRALAADDVLAVRAEASACVRRVREAGDPVFLYLQTYRFGPHSKGDDLRPREEIEARRARDPLALLAASLDPAAQQKTEAAVEERLRRAVAAATAASPQSFDEYHARVTQSGGYAL